MKDLRVLQVEDSESDAALIMRYLQKSGYTVHAHRVEEADSMRKALAQQDWDIILADFQLPQFDAAAALRIRNECAPDVPFIIVSGTIGEDRAVEMMLAGARDYVLKDRLARLAPAVQRETREAHARRQRRQEYRQLEAQLREKENSAKAKNLDVDLTLKENTALLQEVQHRVRNNLQTICSLLSMQISCLPENDRSSDQLHKVNHRILAMSLVHEELFHANRFATINFADYGNSLAGKLYRAYNVDPARVHFESLIDPVPLTIDDAMNCGLILNELLINALKYAFPDDRSGTIRIALQEFEPGKARLSFSDDGVGLPASFDYEDVTSLGLKLVQALGTQLGGQLNVNSKHGTEFIFEWQLARS